MKAQTKKTKTPAKAASKPAVKAVKKTVAPIKPVAKAKSAAQPVSEKKPSLSVSKKTVVKPEPAKAGTKPVHPVIKTLPKRAVTEPVKPASKDLKVADSPKAAPTPAPVSSSALITPKPLKPGRRSSARVAAQTPPPAPMVPTHAPDAAKASYSTMIERVIAPPIQVLIKKDPKLANNWKTKPGEQLTDDEVKAMPDSEYMNEKQLAFFRHKLSVLKQEIHNSAGATTEHLREDAAVVPDPADRATIEEEHALELRTRDRERKLLKKIEQSITRIDSGDYGYCDETGEAIGVGRLIARPTANLSLEAQQRRELKQKMFGD